MKIITLFFTCLIFGLTNASSEELSPEQNAEIQILKKITEELEESNQSFAIPNDILVYSDNSIKFYVYTQSHTSGTVLRHDQSSLLSSIPGFSTNSSTVFVIHGWQVSGIPPITDALIAKGTVNVVSVNWSTYSYLLYLSAVSYVPNVGKTVAKFIEGMFTNYNYSADQIILMGHSLGAHVSGFAGKELNGIIGVIVGIDPAGPLYLKSSSFRLNSGDAQYVEAVHTNAQFLGVNYNLANADFWPNGGYTQSPCSIILQNTCSHNIAPTYIAESITNNQFFARKCGSFSDYTSGNCANNNLALMGGLVFDTSATGVFYLNTSTTSPYGLGDIFANTQP